jgi:hypothetical protein
VGSSQQGETLRPWFSLPDCSGCSRIGTTIALLVGFLLAFVDFSLVFRWLTLYHRDIQEGFGHADLL